MDIVTLQKAAFYLGIGLGLAGSAWGLSIAFQAAMGAGKQKFFAVLPLAVLPSTQGIYSLLAGLLKKDALAADPSIGLIVLLVVGISCFVSALYQGKVCAAGIRSIADDRNVLANGIVSAAMPETYAVLGFVSVFLF